MWYAYTYYVPGVQINRYFHICYIFTYQKGRPHDPSHDPNLHSAFASHISMTSFAFLLILLIIPFVFILLIGRYTSCSDVRHGLKKRVFVRRVVVPSHSVSNIDHHVSFWWETKNGSTVNNALARIMHAAVKSAVIAGIPEETLQPQQLSTPTVHDIYAHVVVFSNTLPVRFFCGEAPAHTFQHAKEQENIYQFTCTYVRIQRYDMNDLLKDHSHQVSTLITNFDKKQLLQNDLSDLLRFLLLYRFGGTYMDLDQMMLRPLPPTSPILVQERSWSKKQCKDKKKRNDYCTYIGEHAISAKCIDPTFDSDTVLSLFSGVMGNFPKQSDLAAMLVASAAKSLGKTCPLGWGCLGPLLVTRVFSQWCKTHDNTPPAFVLPNSMYLVQRQSWKTKVSYSRIWRRSRIAVLDIDFHGKKKNGAMLAGLVDRMLFWKGSKSRNMKDLDEEEYQRFKADVGPDGQQQQSHIDTSGQIDKLPWE